MSKEYVSNGYDQEFIIYLSKIFNGDSELATKDTQLKDCFKITDLYQENIQNIRSGLPILTTRRNSFYNDIWTQ